MMGGAHIVKDKSGVLGLTHEVESKQDSIYNLKQGAITPRCIIA